MADSECPIERRNGGFRFDRHISLGHVLTTAMVIIGVVIGYTRLEAAVYENQKQIAELIKKQAADRVFHVEQRVRIWDKVEQMQSESNSLREKIAELRAGQEHIIRQQERLLELMEKQ